MKIDVSGDVAIVTGAGRNIGQSIATLLASEGAKVTIVDIEEKRARETAAMIRENGGDSIVSSIDIAKEGEVIEMVERTEENFGSVDILVNNAAVKENSSLLEMSVETFNRTVAVNLRGMFICTREAAKSMKSEGGRIINISSTSAHKGEPNAAAYGTSKSGVLNFTRSAAKSLAEYDIRVNTLTPSRTGKATLKDDSRSGEREVNQDDLSDEQIRSRIPAGRIGKPIDQANAALYLASPMSKFVTGVELQVNGGRLS